MPITDDQLKGTIFEYLRDAGTQNSIKLGITGVRAFLDTVYEQERTKPGYQKCDETARYEKLGRRYIADKKRDHIEDISLWLKKSKNAPAGKRAYFIALTTWLEQHGKPITPMQRKAFRKKLRGGEEAPEDALDHSQIRDIVHHADIRMKAAILLMTSTGMRVGEILAMKPNWIDSARRMIIIPPDVTKTQKGRVVFFTEECERVLSAYIAVREKYIEENNKNLKNIGRAAKLIAKDDGRVFPLAPTNMNRALTRTLKKADMFSKNKWNISKIHPHSFRVFFSTHLRRAGMPDSIVETLMGHQIHLGMYVQYKPRDLQEAYEKYSDALVIGDENIVRKTISAIAEKSQEQANVIQNQERTIQELKKRLEEVETVKKQQADITATLSSVVLQLAENPEQLARLKELLNSKK